MNVIMIVTFLSKMMEMNIMNVLNTAKTKIINGVKYQEGEVVKIKLANRSGSSAINFADGNVMIHVPFLSLIMELNIMSVQMLTKVFYGVNRNM